MGLITLTLPRLGETMEEAKVTLWLVEPGAAFQRGDVLLEVETDKTVVEVPALASGVLRRQLVVPGEMVALDQPIAEVEVEGETADVADAPVALPSEVVVPRAAPVAVRTSGARPAASPRARAMARRAGVALATIAGTGRGGRVTGIDVARLAGRAANDDAMVETPFGPMACQRLGQGGALTPVVLLHGLFDDARGWRDLPEKLARAGHSVILLDLPGHGASAAQVETLDEAEAALLHCLPATGPVVLAGHSLGAVLAVRLALRLGERVERVVLSAPAGLGPRIAQGFFDAMAEADTPEDLGAALQMLGAGPVSVAALSGELARLRTRREGMVRLGSDLARGGAQRQDLRAGIAALRCPVTALFGLEDRIIDWTDCRGLPAQAAIHLVAGAGHLPHLAEPALFLRLLGVGGGAASRPARARGGG